MADPEAMSAMAAVFGAFVGAAGRTAWLKRRNNGREPGAESAKPRPCPWTDSNELRDALNAAGFRLEMLLKGMDSLGGRMDALGERLDRFTDRRRA